MRHLPDGQQAAALDRGEAYQRCTHELGRPHPDYQAGQLYATLSMEEALRDMTEQLAQMTKVLVSGSRRR